MTNQKEFNRRLAVLRTEVDLDYKDLISNLDAGMKLILIRDSPLGQDLDPDALRRIGGMVMLCNHYGCGVLYACGIDCGEMRIPTPNS